MVIWGIVYYCFTHITLKSFILMGFSSISQPAIGDPPCVETFIWWFGGGHPVIFASRCFHRPRSSFGAAGPWSGAWEAIRRPARPWTGRRGIPGIPGSEWPQMGRGFTQPGYDVHSSPWLSHGPNRFIDALPFLIAWVDLSMANC